MSKVSKRRKLILEQCPPGKQYSLDGAVELLKSLPAAKFIESVDVSVVLGIDTRKSDQTVRGAVVLPHGTGKNVRVAVFAQGEQAVAAKAAGADIIGYDDLAESIKQGVMDFDVLIATPDSMRVVGQLGQILGPRGLMPNPKVGTVAADVGLAVKNAKGGQVSYRAEKGGIVHCAVGKINFSADALKENLIVFVNDLKRMRPTAAKGMYLKKIAISTTMGPGLAVDPTSVS